MAKHAKTIRLINVAVEILTAHHPMTGRQIYYQLVSRHVIQNNRGQYQAVSTALVDARKEGVIPWDWIEDRLRRPRHVSMWDSLDAFAEDALRSYRRNVWDTQRTYLEVWLEKDALSGIFQDLLRAYGVTLNVGRGYDGWDSIDKAARRLRTGKGVTILYFGDFDPSGEDMFRSLVDRLGPLGCHPQMRKCALTRADVSRYNLPPDFTKATDSRREAFVPKHGDISVELDALPMDVLQDRLRAEVEAEMDLRALAATRAAEGADRQRLKTLLGLH
jgi:hypothetical protein